MIIGIDLGATHIRTMARGPKTLLGEKIHTPKSRPALKKALIKLVNNLAEEKGTGNISGIGIGVAGFLTKDKVLKSPNMKYINGFRLPEFLKKEFGVPVIMDNDAACFLRAEINLGEAKKYRSALGVTIGTGLGAAYSKNKKVTKGEDLKGGEIGHRKFHDKELEDYASAKFLNKTGDFKQLGKNLAEGLINPISELKPECVVLGGGVTVNPKASEFINSFKATLKNKQKTRVPRVLVSGFGEFAGAVGATLLF